MKEEIKTLIDETIELARKTGDMQLYENVLGLYWAMLDLTLDNIELKRASNDIECDGRVTVERDGEEIAEAIHERIQRKIDESIVK